MRTHYYNGDEIYLKACGCDGCCPSMINGVISHEYGCPAAWKDHHYLCKHCGLDFEPRFKEQCICPDCMGDI